MSRLVFVRPIAPSAAVRPPTGDDWLHEPKWDGFRFQIIKDDSGVRFYSRHGAEYTDRLPGIAEAFGKLPTQSAILDGELVLIDPRGVGLFYRLMAQMRTPPGRKPRGALGSSERIHLRAGEGLVGSDPWRHHARMHLHDFGGHVG